jgi:hypothetical protein
VEVVQGALDAIGPWIGTIGPLPLLFIALVRGWLLTPAAVDQVHRSQETRIQEMKANYEARLVEAKERELEWKNKATEAFDLLKVQNEQFDVITELGETSVKLLETVHSARFGISEEQKARTTSVIRPGREV